uniref:FAD-dependent oxidoreductase domain-containing protein 1 n=1 Tax=Tetraselmis chuii TaxID=63592 RepID=A0A7S1STQ5_9CHLO|mmetsp:Transcript_25047/g.44633  ORF Transcript_25047/g.44633 Transcript_25047/m.44633 type:complete len:368 (+) Transcript_25047:79-1182(+)
MWQLAQRSKELWHGLADREGPWEAVEWQRTGSLLLASNSEEAGKLEAQAECLKAAGVQAEMISASAVAKLEPSLSIPAEGGGMLVENDAQINGRNSAFLLLNICRVLAQDAGGEFDCKFGEGVTGLEMDGDGGVVGVTTSAGRRITATRAVVIAGGAWSSDFLAQQLKDNRWKGVIAPRMGQLLALTPPTDMPALTRGVMEMSYSKHYQEVGRKSAEGSPADESAPDITFTATTSASGELLLGSSRQFSGFESSAGLETTAAILKRAAEFMPSLSASAAAVSTLLAGGSPEEWSDGLVRTGPRPWAATGLPFVGPIPGHPRLYIAAGHEGSGLTLAPVTAEIIEGYISNGGTNVAGAEALAPEFLLK